MPLTPNEEASAVAIVTAALNADRELLDRLTAHASPAVLRRAVQLTAGAVDRARRCGEPPMTYWRTWCLAVVGRRS